MPGSLRRPWHVLAALAASILWLGACGASTTATPAGTQPGTSGATYTVLSTATLTACDGSAVSTPAMYVLACADGGRFLDGLHWSAWNAPTSTASGTLLANNCTPNCADGSFVSYPATVSVSGLTGGRYTHMQVDAPGGPFDYTIGPNGPQ